VQPQPGLAVRQVQAGELRDPGEPVVQRLPVDLQGRGRPGGAAGGVEERLSGLGEHTVGQQRRHDGVGSVELADRPPGAELRPVRHGGQVRHGGRHPGCRPRLGPLLGQGADPFPDTGHPGRAARRQTGEGRRGQRPGRAEITGRDERHEDGDRPAVLERGGDRPGSRESPSRREAGRTGGQCDEHLRGTLAEERGERADRLARRRGAAGEGRGERPAEVLVGGGALGQQPAGLRGQVDRGGQRAVSVVRGVDPPAVEEPQVAAGAAGVPHGDDQAGEDPGTLVGRRAQRPLGRRDAELLEPGAGGHR